MKVTNVACVILGAVTAATAQLRRCSYCVCTAETECHSRCVRHDRPCHQRCSNLGVSAVLECFRAQNPCVPCRLYGIGFCSDDGACGTALGWDVSPDANDSSVNKDTLLSHYYWEEGDGADRNEARQ